MINIFLDICGKVGVPIAVEKTEWGSPFIIFLGILLDRIHFKLSIPKEKRTRAIELLRQMLSKNKTTVKEMQSLCGYLNFLCKAIFPGRPFICRMYAKYSKSVRCTTWSGNEKSMQQTNYVLKQYHHIRLDQEFKSDCRVWLNFLDESPLSQVVSRPMIDILGQQCTSTQIAFYSDASRNKSLGFGCLFKERWIMKLWETAFFEQVNPSIEYLELYALTAGIFTWQENLSNIRIVVFCDNTAVVNMINEMSSGCKNCMVLIRLLALNGLRYNRRVAAKYINTKRNCLADALSRNQMTRFLTLGWHMNKEPDIINEEIWPMSKLWMY